MTPAQLDEMLPASRSEQKLGGAREEQFRRSWRSSSEGRRGTTRNEKCRRNTECEAPKRARRHDRRKRSRSVGVVGRRWQAVLIFAAVDPRNRDAVIQALDRGMVRWICH